MPRYAKTEIQTLWINNIELTKHPNGKIYMNKKFIIWKDLSKEGEWLSSKGIPIKKYSGKTLEEILKEKGIL